MLPKTTPAGSPGACAPSYIDSFCEYIGISVAQFWAHVHKSINPKLFEVGRDGAIRRRYTVGVGL